jgi:hypothetical protein
MSAVVVPLQPGLGAEDDGVASSWISILEKG